MCIKIERLCPRRVFDSCNPPLVMMITSVLVSFRARIMTTGRRACGGLGKLHMVSGRMLLQLSILKDGRRNIAPTSVYDIDRVRSRTGLAHPRQRGASPPPGGKAHRVPFNVPKDRLSIGHSLHAECLDVPQDRLSVGLTPYHSDQHTGSE